MEEFMKKYIVSGVLGFLALNVLSAITAMLVLQPTVNQLLRPHIRSMEEGLNFPALTLGYLVITVGLIFILLNFKSGKTWFKKSLVVGSVFGLSVCLGDHLVTAGWSKLHMGAMAFSGVIDTIPVIFAAIVVGFVLRKELEKIDG